MNPSILSTICLILGSASASALFAVLAYEFHFGDGIGLIGWISIPASVACLLSMYAGFLKFYSEVLLSSNE